MQFLLCPRAGTGVSFSKGEGRPTSSSHLLITQTTLAVALPKDLISVMPVRTQAYAYPPHCQGEQKPLYSKAGQRPISSQSNFSNSLPGYKSINYCQGHGGNGQMSNPVSLQFWFPVKACCCPRITLNPGGQTLLQSSCIRWWGLQWNDICLSCYSREFPRWRWKELGRVLLSKPRW